MSPSAVLFVSVPATGAVPSSELLELVCTAACDAVISHCNVKTRKKKAMAHAVACADSIAAIEEFLRDSKDPL